VRNEPLTLPPDYPTALTRFSWALGVIFLCVLAGVGMISVQMGEWPWEFHWLDGNKPDSLVVALVGELRMPLAAISIFGIFVGARLLLKPEDDYRYRNNVEDDLGAVDANPAQYARSISALK